MNSFIGIFCILAAVVCLLLGMVVLRRSWKSFLNIILALNYLDIALVFFGFGKSILSQNAEDVIFWNKIYYLGIIFFPILFLHLIISFFDFKEKFYQLILNSAYFFSGFFAMTDYLTPFFIGGTGKNFTFLTSPRALYYFFFLCFLVLVFYSGYLLLRVYLKTKGLKRTQAQYFFIAGFLVFLGMVINFLTVFGLKIFPFGPGLVIFYPLIVSYAVFENNLIKAKVLYKKGLIYAVIVAFILVVYKIGDGLSRTVAGENTFAASYLFPFIWALIVVLGYNRIEKALDKIIDRFFFKEKYDYRKILLKASGMMATILDLNHLLELITRITMRVMRLDGASILFFDEKEKGYLVLSARGQLKIARGQLLSNDNPLIEFLTTKKAPVVYEVLKNQIALVTGIDPVKEVIFKRLRTQLDRLKAALVIPSFFSGQLVGAFCLGEKKSGDSYGRDDLELLETLANQAAIAVENARRFQENLTMRNFTNTILKFMPQGAAVTNLKGEIIVFNKEAEKITGFWADQVMGRSFENVFRDCLVLSDLIRETIKKGKIYLDEVKFKSHLKKEEKILAVTTSLFEGPSNDKGIIVFIFDKTELQKAREKINEQQKLADFGLMAGGIAHDIKSPLTSIFAVTQLLIKNFNNEGTRQTFCEIMPSEIERLKILLNSLSSYSSEVKLKLKNTDVGELLSTRLKLVEAICLKNDISIVCDFQTLPAVLWDPDIMERVFHNIIFNAIQALDKSKQAKKVLKITTKTKREFFLDVEEDLIIIEISDNGCGMDEKTLQGIFKPFFTTKPKNEGTGLGLALVEKYVKAHSGLISVESKLDEGTNFTLRFPVNPKAK